MSKCILALIFFYKIEDKFYKEEICLLDCIYPAKIKCPIHKEKWCSDEILKIPRQREVGIMIDATNASWCHENSNSSNLSDAILISEMVTDLTYMVLIVGIILKG